MGQYDLGRTNWNPAEIVLNTSNINSNQFGLLFSLPVDGFIFAQPLYLSGITIQGTTRNVVYVATMNNSVFAFDADNPSVGAPLWQVNLGPPSSATVNENPFQTTLGILSTPVIDPVGGLIYVVALTVQNATPIYQLHALSITNGQEQLGGPVTIQASVPGSAADSVNGQIPFNAAIQWQRTALLLNNGSVYFGFGTGVPETQTYHGWLLQYDAANLQLIQAYNTTPNGQGAGVWMSGGGPAADDTGVYYATGNGSFDISGDTGESVIWLGPTSTASFTSFDYATLTTDDLDLGATATLLLPNTNLLVVGGKDGSLYVLNRSNLGGLESGNTQIAQYFLGTAGCVNGPCAGIHNLTTWGLTSSPLLLYLWGAHDVLRGYGLSNDGIFNTTPFATGTVTAGYRGGVLALSSNAQLAGTGVLWATTSTQNATVVPGTLYAFDASSLSALWNSGTNAADTLGNFAKFSSPTVANGKVYVATFSNQLNVYGIHALSSTSLTFGDQTIGTVSAAQEVTFTNGTPTPLSMPSILPSGDFAATSTCGATIAPGTACVISVTFTPTAAGARSGAVTMNDSLIGSPQMIALTGYGLMAQTITFGGLSNQPFGVAQFAVSATASSGLTVSFNSQTLSVCTVSGTTVTLLSVGQCTIQATQPGDGITYAAATSVSQSFQVTPAAQTITFGALSNEPLGTAPFAVTATASSGLTVGFASLTTSVCTVSGTTVTLVAVGVCTIQATQTGGLDYTAAAPVNQSFEVTFQALGASSLLVGSAGGSSSVELTYGGAWTATSNASFLNVSAGSASGAGNAVVAFTCDPFTGTGTRTGTLTIAGFTVTVTQAGTNYIGPGPVTTLVSSGLNNPYGVAVDGSGNVYTADYNNNAIKEWSASTQQLTTLASGLNDPSGLAVDGSGNVYFADSGNHAIKEWSASTQQVTTLAPGLNDPSGVAVDGSGNVYFADSGNGEIYEWSASTRQVTVLVSSGLSTPGGVAVDSSGNVYIADAGNQAIYEWSATTEQVTTLVSSGLNRPVGMAVDGSGNVYFADSRNNAIKEWSASTQQVSTLPPSGLNDPYGVAVDGSGNVYFADSGNNAIKEMPNAWVGPAGGLTEPASAGSDMLLPVISLSSVSLTGVFAPTSNQSWLTIGTIANGVTNFSFTANTTTSTRSANITELGQQITVTQNGLLTGPPAVVSLSPASGTGLTQTFTMVYSDPNGISDLSDLVVVFNTSVSVSSDCAVVYVPGTNKMYLYNNAGTALSTGVIPGSSGSVSNSQCTLAGSGSSFSTSGNNLTLNVALTFTGTFVGEKNVYLEAKGATSSSGWAKKGLWMPASAGPPAVVSLSPASGTGLTQAFTMVYSDPNGISDLSDVLVVFNTSVSVSSGCAVVYVPGTNKMYLYNNAGTALSTAVIPGSLGSVSNSQCTLAGTGSSFTTSGDDLTLTVALTFSTTFVGQQKVYLEAKGSAANSGWVKKGTWTP
jgi:sugar lactone lactonase YvrE